MTPAEEVRWRGRIMFVVALILFVQESLRNDLERPVYIGAYLVMMGVTTIVPGLGLGGKEPEDHE